MLRQDLDLSTPAECLAADEALLDWWEVARASPPARRNSPAANEATLDWGQGGGAGGGLLLFWEPRETFVVVGYANKVMTEVNVAACAAKGVPIYRRCSGGGTVVQMPGGLNYSLILPITEHGPTRNISSANRFIMETNRDALQPIVAGRGLVVSIRGHTDLTLGTRETPPAAFRKFAGNSQRRRRHFLLFHGTLLLQCDLSRLGELLRMPSWQPDYRAGRPHAEFVANLDLPAAAVKTALAQAWNADQEFTNPPHAEIQKLAREKYAAHDWNYKF